MKKAFFIFVLSVTFISACGSAPSFSLKDYPEQYAPITVEDDFGNKIILNKPPERVVVTSASFLEPLHEIGINIVGCPASKNKTPEWAEKIPSIGQVYQIDMESLLACSPDLVIINKGKNENIIDVLNENQILSLVMEMKTYDQVKNTVKIFSQLNNSVERGRLLIDKMDTDIRTIIEKIPKDNKRVAIIHGTTQGLSIQLDKSIAGNIVQMLGWENVASSLGSMDKNVDAAPYSMEIMSIQNPEIIFVTSMGDIDIVKSNIQAIIDSSEPLQVQET